jgi:hypothetical protein
VLDAGTLLDEPIEFLVGDPPLPSDPVRADGFGCDPSPDGLLADLKEAGCVADGKQPAHAAGGLTGDGHDSSSRLKVEGLDWQIVALA